MRKSLCLGAFLAILLNAGEAGAARVRFHYVQDALGNLQFVPPAPDAPQVRVPWPGARVAQTTPPRPNQILTFRHPATGRPVRVPLRLAEGTPRMEYRAGRVVYNYGSDTVEVRFGADGTVDVIYSSGFLRDL